MTGEENTEVSTHNVPREDWFLQYLITIVNRGDITFGITLNVGGFLVSGTLIGGSKYFEGFGEEFVAPFANTESAEEIKKAFVQHGDIYKDEPGLSSLPAYIHLKDARFFNSRNAPLPGNTGVWWRGRVAEVDGFMLGYLSPGDG